MKQEAVKQLLRLFSMRPAITAWNQENFPGLTQQEQEDKFAKECHEAVLEQNKADRQLTDALMEEVADCIIVAFGMCRFDAVMAYKMLEHILANVSDDCIAKLPDYVQRKFEICQKAKWEKINGEYKRVKDNP